MTTAALVAQASNESAVQGSDSTAFALTSHSMTKAALRPGPQTNLGPPDINGSSSCASAAACSSAGAAGAIHAAIQSWHFQCPQVIQEPSVPLAAKED